MDCFIFEFGLVHYPSRICFVLLLTLIGLLSKEQSDMVFTVFFSFSVQIFMINTLHSILKAIVYSCQEKKCYGDSVYLSRKEMLHVHYFKILLTSHGADTVLDPH